MQPFSQIVYKDFFDKKHDASLRIVLFVSGSPDRPEMVLSAKQTEIMRQMAEKIPGARLYMVRDGGHVQHWEQLEAYNKLTLDFLLEK